MVVRIRLQRHGKRNRPFYRITISHNKQHVSNKVIEYLGTYDPLPDYLGTKQLRLNIARTKYWLATGAQPSTTVAKLLSKFHLIPQPPIKGKIQPADVQLLRALEGKGIDFKNTDNIINTIDNNNNNNDNNNSTSVISNYINNALESGKSLTADYIYPASIHTNELSKQLSYKQRVSSISPYVPLSKLYRFEPPKHASATTKRRQTNLNNIPIEFIRPNEKTLSAWNNNHNKFMSIINNQKLKYPINPKPILDVNQNPVKEYIPEDRVPKQEEPEDWDEVSGDLNKLREIPMLAKEFK